jgi:purine-binding chemotaxis protein CheW
MDQTTENLSQLCTFQIGGNYFGVEMDYISESMYMREDITNVPTTSLFLLGVINQRGNVVPIVRINNFLAVEESNLSKNSSILVLQYEKLQVGIVADSVAEIMNISESALESAATENEYIKAIFTQEENLISILDIPKLLLDAKRQVV